LQCTRRPVQLVDGANFHSLRNRFQITEPSSGNKNTGLKRRGGTVVGFHSFPETIADGRPMLRKLSDTLVELLAKIGYLLGVAG